MARDVRPPPTSYDVGGHLTEIVLTSFDPSTMSDDSCSLVVGSRHSGKSVLITDLMWHKRRRLDVLVGMNGTEECNNMLERFTPPCNIYDEYDQEAVHQIMKWQKACRQTDKANGCRPDANYVPPGYTEKTHRVGLVLDDCMGETNEDGKKRRVMGSGDMYALFSKGRHYKLFFICVMQAVKNAPPDVRTNVDYLFVFDGADPVAVHEAWFAGKYSKKLFREMFASATQHKYNCLVYDVRMAKGQPPGVGVFYYKAPVRTRPFHVGAAMQWHLSRHYQVDEAHAVLDPSKVRGVDFDGMAAGRVPLGADGMPLGAMAGADDGGGGGGGSGGRSRRHKDKPTVVVRRAPPEAPPRRGGRPSRTADRGGG